jgi:predicted nucleotidyltransferase
MTELDDNRETEEVIRSVLTAHPVSVGYVFGSLARGETHQHSDIDVAVAFEQDSGVSASERVLSLGADLALELGTDDVDVVDLRRTSPKVARSVLSHGVRLVGSAEAERELESELPRPDRDEQSPADRFDDALAAIESHLG